MVAGVTKYEVICDKHGVLLALDLDTGEESYLKFKLGDDLARFIYSEKYIEMVSPPYELYEEAGDLKALNTVTGDVYEVVLEAVEDEEQS